MLKLTEEVLARASAAREKRAAGKRPTRLESAALNRVQRAAEEEQRWIYYQTIPQKHWVALSGRQAKVVKEQAKRYGIPFGGKVVDLTEVVPALHDFFKENARKLAKGEAEDPLLVGGSSPALERYRVLKGDQEELNLAERRRELVPVEELKGHLGRVAGVLRRAGDTLQRRFGPEAGRVLEDALDDAARIVEEAVGEGVGEVDS